MTAARVADQTDAPVRVYKCKREIEKISEQEGCASVTMNRKGEKRLCVNVYERDEAACAQTNMHDQKGNEDIT
jgi:hypothetical protein